MANNAQAPFPHNTTIELTPYRHGALTVHPAIGGPAVDYAHCRAYAKRLTARVLTVGRTLASK